MSVEAPNNIKFQSPSTKKNTTIQSSDAQAFQQYFQSETTQYTKRTEHSPKSPRQNTTWLEYEGADEKNSADALKKMGTLTNDGLLKFSKVASNQSSFDRVLTGLKSSPNMRHLIIRHSSLSNHHIQTVAKVLQLNDGIAWLVLDHNKMDDRGVQQLAEGLKNNHGVKHVVLADNAFGDEGAVALAQAIKQHPCVETLWVQGNAIGDNGGEALARAIDDHPTLTTVDIRDNQLSESKKEMLKKVCEKNNIRCYG